MNVTWERLLLIITVECHLPLDPSTSIHLTHPQLPHSPLSSLRLLFHLPNPLPLLGEPLIHPSLPRLPLPFLPEIAFVPLCEPGVPLNQQDSVEALADEVQVLTQTLLPQLWHQTVLVEVFGVLRVGWEVLREHELWGIDGMLSLFHYFRSQVRQSLQRGLKGSGVTRVSEWILKVVKPIKGFEHRWLLVWVSQ